MMCRPTPSPIPTSNMIKNNNNSNKKTTGSDKQFPGKLHDMMSFVEANGLEYILSWDLNGFGLRINDPERLVDILPLFFGQTKYRSFRRQMNMWHFHRVLDGTHKGMFIHPYFVKHDRALCCQMSRHLPFKPTPEKEQEYIALVSTCQIVPGTTNTEPESLSSSSSSLLVEQPLSSLDTKIMLTTNIMTNDDMLFVPTKTSSSSSSFSTSTSKQLLEQQQQPLPFPSSELNLGSTTTTFNNVNMMLQQLEDDVICGTTKSTVTDEWSDGTSISSSNNLGWFEGGDFFSLDDIFP